MTTRFSEPSVPVQESFGSGVGLWLRGFAYELHRAGYAAMTARRAHSSRETLHALDRSERHRDRHSERIVRREVWAAFASLSMPALWPLSDSHPNKWCASVLELSRIGQNE
jgi:hypothetical protein